MRRTLLAVLMVGLAALVACSPGFPGPLGGYSSGYNPVSGQEEGLYSSCFIEDGLQVQVNVSHQVFVQLTLPNGQVEADTMVYDSFGQGWTFTSQHELNSGDCYSMLLIDNLGQGFFTFRPGWI